MKNEMICMRCKTVDVSAMVVDETSERMPNMDNGPTFHNQVHNTPGYVELVRNIQFSTKRSREDRIYDKVWVSVAKCCICLNVDTYAFLQPIINMYLSIYGNLPVVKTSVGACCIIYLRRNSEENIKDVVQALGVKCISKDVEKIKYNIYNSSILFNSYGYLVNRKHNIANTVKDEYTFLVECASKSDDHLEVKQKLAENAWGVCDLATSMMECINSARLFGGSNVSIMTRVIIAIAHRFHYHSDGLILLLRSSSAVSEHLINQHRQTWDQAVMSWPGGQAGFMSRVDHTRNMVMFGLITNRPKIAPIV